jgi:CheY-like chemotaxis protein
VPAIAVSAFTNIETQHSAFNPGFHAHVAKPVNVVELAEEILRLTSKTRVARDRAS